MGKSLRLTACSLDTVKYLLRIKYSLLCPSRRVHFERAWYLALECVGYILVLSY